MHTDSPSPAGRIVERPTRYPGIVERHSRRCQLAAGGDRCTCKPSFRAEVHDRKSGRNVRKQWSGPGALSAAKQWRADVAGQLARGRNLNVSRVTLREAAEAWLAGVNADPPTVLTRSGQRYKPSARREYEAALRLYVLPELGAHKLADLRRGDLQRFVDGLLGKGLSPSRVRNIVMPLRVIYRSAVERDQVASNPTNGLRLPNGHTPRDRAATATEAAELLHALPDADRALWATAFYAGLRRGELMALRWEDVDLAAGIIRVHRSWDEQEGEIAPKSAKSTRRVPIVALLRDHLLDHKTRTGRDARDFVFGSQRDRPFTPSNVGRRAATAWKHANQQRAERNLPELEPIGLHECRHTFVSLLHDAGLSLERIGDYVGHSSTYMTDRYRHLLAGHEQEAARLLDEYLARADTRNRLEQLGPLGGSR